MVQLKYKTISTTVEKILSVNHAVKWKSFSSWATKPPVTSVFYWTISHTEVNCQVKRDDMRTSVFTPNQNWTETWIIFKLLTHLFFINCCRDVQEVWNNCMFQKRQVCQKLFGYPEWKMQKIIIVVSKWCIRQIMYAVQWLWKWQKKLRSKVSVIWCSKKTNRQ